MLGEHMWGPHREEWHEWQRNWVWSFIKFTTSRNLFTSLGYYLHLGLLDLYKTETCNLSEGVQSGHFGNCGNINNINCSIFKTFLIKDVS